ncbi:MAG: hypothetical protein HUJ53_05270 [Holdemanella sp.]|nr:hypothetical protein [Holdemanella sp.]
MKKLIGLCLCFCMIFAMMACGSKKEEYASLAGSYVPVRNESATKGETITISENGDATIKDIVYTVSSTSQNGGSLDVVYGLDGTDKFVLTFMYKTKNADSIGSSIFFDEIVKIEERNIDSTDIDLLEIVNEYHMQEIQQWSRSEAMIKQYETVKQ